LVNSATDPAFICVCSTGGLTGDIYNHMNRNAGHPSNPRNQKTSECRLFYIGRSNQSSRHHRRHSSSTGLW
jgi:F0F1-type ATP synthase gamma subunit